jgi:hypothetical protein
MVGRRPQLKWTVLLRISRSVAAMHHHPGTAIRDRVNRLFGFWKRKSAGPREAARMQQFDDSAGNCLESAESIDL